MNSVVDFVIGTVLKADAFAYPLACRGTRYETYCKVKVNFLMIV